jgi:hypothetical protein
MNDTFPYIIFGSACFSLSAPTSVLTDSVSEAKLYVQLCKIYVDPYIYAEPQRDAEICDY